MVLGIILAIIVVLVIAAIMLYNNLVKMRNMVDNAWAQIDVQLAATLRPYSQSGRNGERLRRA